MCLKRNPKFKCPLFLLIPTSFVEGQNTCMDLENFCVTPSLCHDYHLTLVEYIIQQNTQSVFTTRKKETDRDTFFYISYKLSFRFGGFITLFHCSIPVEGSV
jgi:hypothetical protein